MSQSQHCLQRTYRRKQFDFHEVCLALALCTKSETVFPSAVWITASASRAVYVWMLSSCFGQEKYIWWWVSIKFVCPTILLGLDVTTTLSLAFFNEYRTTCFRSLRVGRHARALLLGENGCRFEKSAVQLEDVAGAKGLNCKPLQTQPVTADLSGRLLWSTWLKHLCQNSRAAVGCSHVWWETVYKERRRLFFMSSQWNC